MAAAWSWRIIVITVGLVAVGYVFRYLSEVFVPLSIAILLTAMLIPITNRLHSFGMPRGLATAITVIGGIVVIAGAFTLIGTVIASQSNSLTKSVVETFNELSDWLQNGPLRLDQSWFQWDEWVKRIQQFVTDSQEMLTQYATDIGAQVGHFLAGLAITLFALFFFLHDGRGIFSFLLKFVPARVRARVDFASQRGWKSLSSYVRATIVVALVDALGVLAVALALQVPLAPALAALVFLGAFIPIVGAFVSGFVAVGVALVAVGWVQGLIMLAGIILVMQIEGHVLQPLLLGRAVKLHPLAVLLAIAIGLIVSGIVGALIAVPVLAFAKTFVVGLYGGPEPVLDRSIRWPVRR